MRCSRIVLFLTVLLVAGCATPPKDYGQIPTATDALGSAQDLATAAQKSSVDTVKTLGEIKTMVLKRIAEEDAKGGAK